MSMQLSGRRVFLANGNGKYLDQVAGSWQGQETSRRLLCLELSEGWSRRIQEEGEVTASDCPVDESSTAPQGLL